MTPTQRIGGVLLMLGLGYSFAGAQQQNPSTPPAYEITAVPNRPTFSTTAESVQPGVFEIEYGMEAARGHQDINGLLKFGLTSTLELRFFNLPLQRDGAIAGFGDTGAGLKYRFFSQSQHRPTFSALYTATIPSATHDLGAGAWGHSVQLLASKDFGNHHFDLNEGAQLVGRQHSTGGFDRNYFSALAYSHPISTKWAMSAELAGFSRTNASSPGSMTLLIAPTRQFSPRLVVDFGAYYACFGELPRVTVFSGVTYSVADLYRRRHSRMSGQ